ncbi:Cysteine-rich receptor-like protein kinase 25 [Bienertia sinuspersici]
MEFPTNLLHILIPVFVIIGQVSSQTDEPDFFREFCSDDLGNYTAESTYQANLNHLLANLTTLASSSHFNNYTVGEGTDQTYGLYMCRGDFNSEECDTCIKAASTKTLEKCPVQKEAIMWYDDCMVRYSNRNIFSLEEVWPIYYRWNEHLNASDPLQFSQLLADTVNGLIPQGAYNTSNRGYATGQAKMSLFEDLYVLIQCTPDILGAPCERCLKVALRNVGSCCNNTLRIMTSMYLPSCWLLYSSTPFVREHDTTPPISPSPSSILPPPPRPPSSDVIDNSNTIPAAITPGH